MALSSTARTQDIINALTNLEGINAKADLAAVIGSPAKATDTPATLVSHIQKAKNDLAAGLGRGNIESLQVLASIVSGGVKRFASGPAPRSGSTLSFYNNGYVSEFYTRITDLDFKPSIVIIWSDNGNLTTIVKEGTNNFYGPSGDRYLLGDSYNAFLKQGEFQLPIARSSTTITFQYIAFE